MVGMVERCRFLTFLGVTGCSGLISPPLDGADMADLEGTESPPSIETIPDAFTRLTAAEYAATLQDAFGFVPSLSLLPGDGRVGAYTSNAVNVPDPVYAYMLAAEEVAAEVVPAELPPCSGADARACVDSAYSPAISRLYRRQVRPEELDNLTRLLTDLEDLGMSARDATRAMLTAVLTGPDFLFHTALANDGPAGARRRIAERLSYAIWDAPPDDELISELEVGAAELTQRLLEQTDRLLEHERATPVVARFLGQWLHVDIDLRLESPAFATSPRYLELLAFVREALINDMPIMDFLAGTKGFVHPDNAAAYDEAGLGVISSGSEVVPVTWSTQSLRRGLVSQDLFMDATRHPDVSRRVIFRGLLVQHSLLCTPIPKPDAELVAAAGEVTDRTVDSRCSACHLRLDPIGQSFHSLDPDADVPGEPYAASVIGQGELDGTYTDLAALLEAVSESRSFAECFATNWLAFFLEQPADQVDPGLAFEIADLVQQGASLRDVVRLTMVRLAEHTNPVPWCEGS